MIDLKMDIIYARFNNNTAVNNNCRIRCKNQLILFFGENDFLIL